MTTIATAPPSAAAADPPASPAARGHGDAFAPVFAARLKGGKAAVPHAPVGKPLPGAGRPLPVEHSDLAPSAEVRSSPSPDDEPSVGAGAQAADPRRTRFEQAGAPPTGRLALAPHAGDERLDTPAGTDDSTDADQLQPELLSQPSAPLPAAPPPDPAALLPASPQRPMVVTDPRLADATPSPGIDAARARSTIRQPAPTTPTDFVPPDTAPAETSLTATTPRAAAYAAPTSAPVGENSAATARSAAATATADPARRLPLTSLAAAPTPISTISLPTFQAFGAALHRAVVAERRPVGTPDAQSITTLAPATPPSAFAATQPVDTGQFVDTAHPGWPEAMMARIETIRDAQDAGDTRIRLHPDALGAVEVTLRRDAAGIQVRLDAAEPATRALLADAQPRLQELAETRAFRLAGTEVAGSGTGQGSTDGHRRQSAPVQIPIRRPAAATVAADGATDTRLA